MSAQVLAHLEFQSDLRPYRHMSGEAEPLAELASDGHNKPGFSRAVNWPTISSRLKRLLAFSCVAGVLINIHSLLLYLF